MVYSQTDSDRKGWFEHVGEKPKLVAMGQDFGLFFLLPIRLFWVSFL